MGKLKVTIEHGHSSSDWLVWVAAGAAFLLLASATGPAIAAISGATTVALAMLWNVLLLLLCVLCVAGVIYSVYKTREILKDRKGVQEYRKKYGYETPKPRETGRPKSIEARKQKQNDMFVESKRLDKTEA